MAAAAALEAAGMVRDAAEFRACGLEFQVDVCTEHVGHQPRIVPHSCHKPYCPECAHREQARRLARYVPVIHDAVAAAPAGYSLKHLVLTTPFDIESPDHEAEFEKGFRWAAQAVREMGFQALDSKNKLTKAEKRRNRVDLAKQGIGYLISAEHGENGHKLHFHVLGVLPYLDKEKVVNPVWERVTGGVCKVVWIKKVDDLESSVKEVTKYITKLSNLEPELVPVLAKVLKGRRRLRSYGTFYNAVKPEKPEPMTCEVCGSARRLLGYWNYQDRCERQGVPLDDSIVARAFLVFSSELEISSGKLYTGHNYWRGKAPPD